MEKIVEKNTDKLDVEYGCATVFWFYTLWSSTYTSPQPLEDVVRM